jgi:alkaline phosphatase D
MDGALKIGRRRLLVAGAAAGGLVAAGGLPVAAAANGSRRLPRDPFTLGVASGDPSADGVVLWTRLAPDPLEGGGMPDRPVRVEWEVATDERMRRVVRRGSVYAVPDRAHAVHAEVHGLRSDSWYWYRFRAEGYLSMTGRTRTTPAAHADPRRLRFAFVSCQNWQDGLWPAYHGLASEDLDLVVPLGDYIYEGGVDPAAVRQHNSPEIVTLADYRNRHALYRTDPSLQAAHAAFPWMITWDDHEVDNNYAGDVPEDGQPDFLARREVAYQAYEEHMPLPRRLRQHGTRVYRDAAWGRLLGLHVLDTRQYRTDQPCGDGIQFPCPAQVDPAATMTGPEQERWLLRELDRSRARWNVIAQQVIMARVDFLPGDGEVFNMDQWDGYVAARNRLLGFVHHRQPSNPVVITGDIHSSWVSDLKADFLDPDSATIGTEFVGTSISSDFPVELIPAVEAALPGNPHLRYFDGRRRGYTRCEVTKRQWQTDYRTVETTLDPEAPVTTTASFVVADGEPGAIAV